MEIILTYHSGRKTTSIDVAPGQTVRDAIRKEFGHENEFLFVGGNLPENMDAVLEEIKPVIEQPVVKEVILEGPSSGSDQPVEIAPKRTRPRKFGVSKSGPV